MVSEADDALPGGNATRAFDELRLAENLPSPPGLGLSLLGLTRDDQTSNTGVIDYVRADAVLTGRLLRLANASRPAGSAPATTALAAANLVSPEALREIALGFRLVSRAASDVCSGFEHRQHWLLSLATAASAEALAEQFHTTDPEESFTIGLLSRVGVLAMATVHPSAFAQVLRDSRDGGPNDLALAEMNTLGINHWQVAAEMMTDWGIPETLRQPLVALSRDAFRARRDDAETIRGASLLNMALEMAEGIVACEAARAPELAGAPGIAGASGIGSRSPDAGGASSNPSTAPDGVALARETAVRKWRALVETCDLSVRPEPTSIATQPNATAAATPGSLASNAGTPTSAATAETAAPDAVTATDATHAAAATAATGAMPATGATHASGAMHATGAMPATAATPATGAIHATGAMPATDEAGGANQPGNRVLVVDDEPSARHLISLHLRRAGFEVIQAVDGESGLRAVVSESPDIVITDWLMPGMSGLELCKALRKSEIGKKLYLLLVTAREEEDSIVEGFEAGANDYLTKPFNPRILLARVRAGKRMVELQHQIELDKRVDKKRVADMAKLTREFRIAATRDVLTGLSNRRSAMTQLQEFWAAAVRYGRPLSVAMIDIDHFKLVNDQYGHQVGDAVLRSVANVLRSKTRRDQRQRRPHRHLRRRRTPPLQRGSHHDHLPRLRRPHHRQPRRRRTHPEHEEHRRPDPRGGQGGVHGEGAGEE